MLEVRGLTKRFGGLAAVELVDFKVGQGEIVGLIGPNGAGKTTVFNVITGVLRPTAGLVLFKEEDVTGCSSHGIARKGIARSFQLTSVFGKLSVIDNVRVASYLNPQLRFWQAVFHTSGNGKKEAQTREKAMEILKLVGLEEYRDRQARSLPHGHRRMLGMAVGLAAEPELLLLDEPLTGMNAGEAEDAVGVMTRIREESGQTILLIEHNMRAVMGLCHRLVVMNFGKKIAEGTPQEIRENDDVIAAYLGAGTHAAQR
jgi:branched-chain amino acid transport system ATP-binding protein